MSGTEKDYAAEARRLASNALFESIVGIGANGGALSVPRTPTAQELKEADERAAEAKKRADAERNAMLAASTREALLDRRLREAAEERDRLARKLEKLAKKRGKK